MDASDVRRQWANRTGEYSPAYYAHYGPNETSEWLRTRLERFAGPDAAVLELGCSSGRHLAHLREHGFEDVHGVEINDDAFDVMEATYPGLAREGTFYRDAIEHVVHNFDDGRFGAVYSVETLQHLHPDAEWIFAELARITDDLLVTVENEGGSTDAEVSYVNDEFPLYHRNWSRVFTELGFVAVDSRTTKRNTARAFRTAGD